MNELRGVKLELPIPPLPGNVSAIGEIAPEALERLAAKYNATGTQRVRIGGARELAGLARIYVKNGALYADLVDVPQAVMDNLKALKQEDVSLCVTLHLGPFDDAQGEAEASEAK